KACAVSVSGSGATAAATSLICVSVSRPAQLTRASQLAARDERIVVILKIAPAALTHQTWRSALMRASRASVKDYAFATIARNRVPSATVASALKALQRAAVEPGATGKTVKSIAPSGVPAPAARPQPVPTVTVAVPSSAASTGGATSGRAASGSGGSSGGTGDAAPVSTAAAGSGQSSGIGGGPTGSAISAA